MNIPEGCYLTGIWEVSEQDEFAAKEAARAYHANRSVCLATQKQLPASRFGFIVILVVLCAYYVPEFWQKDLSNYMAVICACYAVVTLFFVLVRKNLAVPAWGSLVFLLEIFRLDDWTAITLNVIPMGVMGALAYFHTKQRRWLIAQPGYPAFHDIEVRVKERFDFAERDVPAPSEPAEDPYKDILSNLQ